MDDKQIEEALRAVISSLDYDLHKSIENDEETGEDHYPELVAQFKEAAR